MALKAQYKAYNDKIKSADGSYPNESTCSAPPEIPFGTKIKVSGTGTYVDGRVYTVTDRGSAVQKTGDRYIFDLWMPSEWECHKFGRHNGKAEVVKGSSPVKSTKSSNKTRGCDIVSVAAKEIGYRETGNNMTKYGAWYGMNGAAWCHMFVSWCAAKAGIPASVVPKTASTSEGMEWFKSRGIFKYKGKYTPKRGDLVYFKTGRNHVGIVEKVTGSTLHTIEGNTPCMVARKTYPLSEKTITGYGVPKYT
ncbi:MAG: CHAP domain-containing protein, partial [Lachnospiraceae bacterium]|nr:CHAP domain-containing protein [Lachnospiraceae bacterium]